MFSKLKAGDKVYMAYGGGATHPSYSHTLVTIKKITPKKKLISIGHHHFYSDTGKSTVSDSTLHLEMWTPELETELTHRKEIVMFIFKLLDDPPTYEQMLKMKEIMNWTDLKREVKKPACIFEE